MEKFKELFSNNEEFVQLFQDQKNEIDKLRRENKMLRSSLDNEPELIEEVATVSPDKHDREAKINKKMADEIGKYPGEMQEMLIDTENDLLSSGDNFGRSFNSHITDFLGLPRPKDSEEIQTD